jgi:hypothetical protein
MFARFRKPFSVQDPKLGKVTYPRGWAGELDDKTFAAAKAANVLVPGLEASPGTGEDTQVGKKGAKAAKAVDEAEKTVAAAQAKLAAATGDLEKQAAQKELDAAEAVLSGLKA